LATSQALASQAGVQILARGGSAVGRPPLAANAVLAVTEPMMDGLGGDLFCLYRRSRQRRISWLNASGPAPRALSPDFLKEKGITPCPSKASIA